MTLRICGVLPGVWPRPPHAPRGVPAPSPPTEPALPIERLRQHPNTEAPNFPSSHPQRTEHPSFLSPLQTLSGLPHLAALRGPALMAD